MQYFIIILSESFASVFKVDLEQLFALLMFYGPAWHTWFIAKNLAQKMWDFKS